ncbi:MAG: hypothetical protein CMC07_06075 [Flavobacteriaceae bacterium]|nr:hypothetical protein [Flavobacteriaceae bacterium]
MVDLGQKKVDSFRLFLCAKFRWLAYTKTSHYKSSFYRIKKPTISGGFYFQFKVLFILLVSF